MNFMMLALLTADTFLRPFARAYSKAYFAMRVVPKTLIGLMLMPASSRIAPWPLSSASAESCAT